MKRWEDAAALRGKPKAKFDQLFATRATIRARVRILADNGDLEKKKILLIGDDDLLSMAIEDAAEDRWPSPPQVTVIDIDDALLDLLSRLSSNGLRTLKYDVRDPFPDRMKFRFDVVFTDPPYTVDGQTTFLARARAALKNKPSSVCYVCYSTRDLRGKSILKIQTAINQMGFAIDTCWPTFNRYESAKRRKSENKITDFESSLLRLRLVSTERKPVMVGKRIYRYD